MNRRDVIKDYSHNLHSEIPNADFIIGSGVEGVALLVEHDVVDLRLPGGQVHRAGHGGQWHYAALRAARGATNNKHIVLKTLH